MRIRFSLTLDIDRDREHEPDKQGAESSIETAGERFYEVGSDDTYTGVVQARTIGVTRR